MATAVPNAETTPPIQSASNSANTNSGSISVEPSGYRPTSVLISRRGDLPLPTEEDRSHLSHTGVDEKWVALGGTGKEIAVNNTHQTAAKTTDLAGVNNLNNTGIFGDSKSYMHLKNIIHAITADDLREKLVFSGFY